MEEDRGKGGDVTEQVGRSHIKKHLEFPLRALDFSCAQQRAIEKMQPECDIIQIACFCGGGEAASPGGRAHWRASGGERVPLQNPGEELITAGMRAETVGLETRNVTGETFRKKMRQVALPEPRRLHRVVCWTS